jgi:dGTPase
MNLAIYACDDKSSLGRIINEPASPLRNDFQRDRDRIIHSSSFRRLQYKTQVFVNHEGDMFRSRLTHSLEVAQIARGIARTLKCHEDLVEAIALAHDLGHTPFGHAGQNALNKCMKSYGGFEHNLQSLRVVDELEKRYANFNGLNLTYEVREGILKHCSKKNAPSMGNLGLRFINKTQPSLEAQIVNIADEIAYSHHDLDDGFRSGILNFKLLNQLELFNFYHRQVLKEYKSLENEQIINEVIRRMMSNIIADVCDATSRGLMKMKPKSVKDIRALPPLVKFSTKMHGQFLQIKNFSRKNLYEHSRISEMTKKAEQVILFLFGFFRENDEFIPESFNVCRSESNERIIADYIAGMTDRYANQLYARFK